MIGRPVGLAIVATMTAITAMSLSTVSTVAAAPIVSDLNCAITGPGCTSTSSFGSVTFSNVAGTTGGDVKIAVDLTGTVNKVLAGFLNFDFAQPAGSLSVSGAVSSMTVASNGISAGSCIGCFDIELGGGASTGLTDKATVTLHSSTGALHVSDFFLANAAGLDAAAHIGNIGPGSCVGVSCVPGTPGSGSVFAGERVPEPSSALWLLVAGVGLVAVGRFATQK